MLLGGWVLFCGGANAEKNIVGSSLTPLLLKHAQPHPDGKKKCLADGGQIAVEKLPDGRWIYVCTIERCYAFDDGEECQIHRCELESYYTDTCVEPVPPWPPFVPDGTVKSYFNSKVIEILKNLDNTGYAHNKDDNFSLIPNYTDLAAPHTAYNLFLDCSGFVGYYVLQGLAENLYQAATPSDYICQDRPLAADFADIIKDAPQVGADHPAAIMDDLIADDVFWGQVEHVRDIKAGDVIVYKHPKNIGKKDKDCHGRKIHRNYGNTGHILFAHSGTFVSTHCKANSLSCSKYEKAFPWVDWQYGLRVADSTTSRHGKHDSRKVGKDKSEYDGNKYHAWSAEEGGVVERCDDGAYHRHCIFHGSTAVEGITIDTGHPTHPTGIGVGTMYISPDRKSYRGSYTSDNVFGDEKIVFIGRPIKCPP
jgi:hypothetical protein